jgi:hypothetical protein
MVLYLLNTSSGLKPLYDEDADEKRKLKLGETYRATIVHPRNILFHRKFFALIKLGFENSKMVEHSRLASETNEKVIPMTQESYRKFALIKSGFANVYQTTKGVFVEAQSISFDSMDEGQFSEVYSKCLDFVIKDTQADEKLFMEQLLNFI